MLLYQQKQRSKSNVKQNGVEGIYVPREGRIEQKRAFCSAHFSLGNPNQSFMHLSSTQDQYLNTSQNPLNPSIVAETQHQNAALKQKSRNSNFSFSQSNRPAKFSNVTSAGQAFTPEKLKMKDQAHVGDGQSMRVANFRMGFEPSMDYGTTTDQNNKFFRQESNRETLTKAHNKKVLDQKDRVTRNRVPHYDFGRTAVNYQSSNKDQFTQHNLSHVIGSKHEAQKNGADVRKSHFTFGTDSNQLQPNTTKNKTSPLQNPYAKVDGATMGAAKTNIQIYHNGVAAGSNRFTSTYRSSNSLHQQPYRLAQRVVSNAYSRMQSANMDSKNSLQQQSNPSIELRKANFSLGTNNDQLRSTNQSNLNEHKIPSNQTENRDELKARMAKTQFSFGNATTSMSQNQSLYKSEIDKQAKQGGQAANGREVRSQLKKTNISIGNGTSTQLQSEAKHQFVTQRTGNASTIAQHAKNLDLRAKLKGHNFTLREQKQGGQVNNYFQTSHNETFNKGSNPNDHRARIPESQKRDAHKEHYHLGFDKSTFQPKGAGQTYNFQQPRDSGQHFQAARSMNASSTNFASNNPSNALMQASLIANKQKQCNVAIGGAPSAQKSTMGNGQTSNQSFFRWIQPKIR